MSEKGIMFATPMILAITKYHCKSHTRRIESSLKKINENPNEWELIQNKRNDIFTFRNVDAFNTLGINYFMDCKPRYQVGDVLYLKETWSPVYVSNSYEYPDETCYFEWDDSIRGKLEKDARGLRIFRKTDKLPAEFSMGEIGWRSAMLMFKWMARSTRLQVLSVIAKRAQDMNDKDAEEEGVEIWWQGLDGKQYDNFEKLVCRAAKLRDPKAIMTSEVDKYAVLIDSIDKKTQPWKNNLWLYDYEFKEI